MSSTDNLIAELHHKNQLLAEKNAEIAKLLKTIKQLERQVDNLASWRRANTRYC